ncbi:MAG: hypothetical protein Q9221_006979 [Calogaya cf. arnoldii]
MKLCLSAPTSSFSPSSSSSSPVSLFHPHFHIHALLSSRLSILISPRISHPPPPPRMSPPTRIAIFCSSSTGSSHSHTLAARTLAQSLHQHSIQLVYGGGTSGLMGEVARTLVKLSGEDAVLGVIPNTLLGVERPNQGQGKGKGKPKEAGKEKGEKLPRNWARRMGLAGGGGEEKGKGAKADERREGDQKSKLLLNSEYGHLTIVPSLQARKLRMMELVRDGGPGSGFVALSGGIGTIDELFEVLSWGMRGVHSRGVCVLNVGGFWDGVLGWVERAVEEGFVREKGERAVLGDVRSAGEVVGWLRGWDEGKGRAVKRVGK